VGSADAEGAAPRIRDVEPGSALAERGGVRGLPHALRARGGGEGERSLDPEPAAERLARLSDLSSVRGVGDPDAGGADPGEEPRPAAAGGWGDRGDAGYAEGGEGGRGDGCAARAGAGVAQEGAVAAGLRGGGEQHRVPRPGGGRAAPGGGARCRAGSAGPP